LAVYTLKGQVKSVELPRSPCPDPAPVLEESCSR
jgi:hypothetical protein